MASEWSLRKLADLCDSIDYGYTASAKETPCGPQFLRITDIVSGFINWESVPYCEIEDSATERFRLHDGDVVIARTGATTGYSAYIANPPDAVFASYLVRLKIGQEAHARFIAYFLKSHIFWSYIRGVLGDKSAQPNASAKTMTQVTLQLPPLKDQQAIACILGALDDKIELNRRMNKTLEGIARAIFKSWFVDFDPVRSKAASQQPSGLKPDLAALFPDAFEESELGEIPKGWMVHPIGDVVQVWGGGTPSTKEPNYWKGGIHPFCTPKDMASLIGPVLLQTERHLTNEGLAKVSSGQLPIGTLLLSSRAPIGYLAITEIPMSVNQGIIAMICNGELPNLYVLHWTSVNMDRIIANANGSTFLEISKRNFRQICAVIPQADVLERFMQIVGPMHRRVVSSLRQILYSAAIRDALLPKLVAGELRIQDAERIVGRII